MNNDIMNELLEVIETLKTEIAKQNEPEATEATTIKIDDDVPMAARKRRKQTKYPIPDLEVGQSFFLPGENASQLLSSIAGHYTADGQKKFTIRQAKENGVFGARLWRVK